MKKRLALILITLGLLFVPVAAAPIVEAAGYCNLATVTLSGNVDGSGSNRTFCYGINDNDIETEAISTPIGPLNTGAYLGDYDPSETQSGVLWARFTKDAGDPTRICFYTGKNYTGNYSYRSSSGTISFNPGLTPGSLRFRVDGSCL